MVRIVGSHPILASRDIAASLAFYTQKLGFAVEFEMDSYGIVVRDDIQIHIMKPTDGTPARPVTAYFSVLDVDGLYAAMKRVGVRMAPPVDQPYGMREFQVWDLDENFLMFGEELNGEVDKTAKA